MMFLEKQSNFRFTKENQWTVVDKQTSLPVAEIVVTATLKVNSDLTDLQSFVGKQLF